MIRWFGRDWLRSNPSSHVPAVLPVTQQSWKPRKECIKDEENYSLWFLKKLLNSFFHPNKFLFLFLHVITRKNLIVLYTASEKFKHFFFCFLKICFWTRNVHFTPSIMFISYLTILRMPPPQKTPQLWFEPTHVLL